MEEGGRKGSPAQVEFYLNVIYFLCLSHTHFLMHSHIYNHRRREPSLGVSLQDEAVSRAGHQTS